MRAEAEEMLESHDKSVRRRFLLATAAIEEMRELAKELLDDGGLDRREFPGKATTSSHSDQQTSLGLVMRGTSIDGIIPGSPAARSAQLRRFDEVIAVDGTVVNDETVKRCLAGAAKSDVRLRAKRSGHGAQEVEVVLRRVLSSSLADGQRLHSLLDSLSANADFVAAFEEENRHRRAGAEPSLALVASLRDEINSQDARRQDMAEAHEQRLQDCTQTLLRHLLSLQELVSYLAQAHSEMLEAASLARSALQENDEAGKRMEGALKVLADQTGKDRLYLEAQLDEMEREARVLRQRVGELENEARVFKQRIADLEATSLSLECRLDDAQRELREFGFTSTPREAPVHLDHVKRLQERVEFELEHARVLASEREAERGQARERERAREADHLRERNAVNRKLAQSVKSWGKAESGEHGVVVLNRRSSGEEEVEKDIAVINDLTEPPFPGRRREELQARAVSMPGPDAPQQSDFGSRERLLLSEQIDRLTEELRLACEQLSEAEALLREDAAVGQHVSELQVELQRTSAQVEALQEQLRAAEEGIRQRDKDLQEQALLLPNRAYVATLSQRVEEAFADVSKHRQASAAASRQREELEAALDSKCRELDSVYRAYNRTILLREAETDKNLAARRLSHLVLEEIHAAAEELDRCANF